MSTFRDSKILRPLSFFFTRNSSETPQITVTKPLDDSNERTPLISNNSTSTSTSSSTSTLTTKKKKGDDDEESYAHHYKTTPLPKGQLFILCSMRFTEPIVFTCIFPFINQMIEDLHIADDPKKVGYYAGIIESTFALLQFLTIIHWGRLSDSIGRKPIMLIGLSGVTISSLLFGLSTTFPALLFSRSLCGALNGNIAVLKSIVGEITDPTNVARAFGMLPLCWAVGAAIGPLLGGFLSRPATRYPLYFDTPFFRKFPYFLPTAVAAIFPACAFIVGFFFLKETLPSKRIRTLEENLNPSPSASQTHNQIDGNGTNETVTGLKDVEGGIKNEKPRIRDVLTKKVLIVLLNYGMLALQTISLDALLTLFCYTRVEFGGLGMSDESIGKALSYVGLLSILIQLLLFPFIQRRIGTVSLYRACMVTYPIIFSLFPISNSFARSGNQQQASYVLWCILTLKVLANMVYACNMILVNASAPPLLLGTLNGVAQSVASFMRSLGPAAATSIFALSVDKQVLGGKLVWLVFSGLATVSFGTSCLLQEVEGEREAREGRWRRKVEKSNAVRLEEEEAREQEAMLAAREGLEEEESAVA